MIEAPKTAEDGTEDARPGLLLVDDDAVLRERLGRALRERASRRLGIHRRSMQRKLQRHARRG